MSGFSVEVYAAVTDPVRLAFAPDGTLYVGRDNTGSGGTNGDAVKIHRISVGGATVATYGATAIFDPDALVVDVNGDIGSVGSVLVGGVIGAFTGHITEIGIDESVTTVFNTTDFDNPSDIVIDSGGRLLFTNFRLPGGSDTGIYQTTGATPIALFTTEPDIVKSVDLDPTGRIFVTADDGTIRIYSATGTLIDPAFATGLGSFPQVAIGAFGDLPIGVFTVSLSGELLHIDFAGGQTVAGTGFTATTDLEFGPDGALYVSEHPNDRVLRIVPELAVPALSAWGIGAVAALVTGCALGVLARRNPRS
jgi:WD40 repeat protein